VGRDMSKPWHWYDDS